MTVIPYIGNNRDRGNSAIPLAIHAVSQPLAQKEPVTRDEIIEPPKAEAEGALEKIKVVLGWVYNTHTLCVSLPNTNFLE